jgi:hypothetical protein
MPMEFRMQTRLARSWSAFRYDLSSQRALDNASRMRAEHDRLVGEIDALAQRLDAALPPEPEVAQPAQRVA